MPIRKDTTDADIAAAVKWAGSAKASKEEAAPGAPTEAAPSKPMTSPNVSGLPDPVGDFARGGLENFMTSHPVGRAPTDEEMDWQQRAGRGVAKGLAGDVVGARSLAGHVPGLNEMLAKIPQSAPLKRAYRGMKEFSGRPDTSIAETAGRVLGGGAPFAFAPVGEGAAAVSRMFPGAARMATPIVTGLEGAAVGGAAGAVQSPENPEAGAVPGMIGGAMGPVVGSAFRNPISRFAGSIILPEAVYKGLSWASGDRLPYYPFGASIVWHSSPVGKRLRRVGSKITDEAGRLIGSIPPGLLGTAAGQALGGGPAEEQNQ